MSRVITERVEITDKMLKPSKRLIDADDLIKIIDKYYDADECNGFDVAMDIMSDISSLPSAQPEIIMCKDCKWYGRVDKRRFYRGMDCLQKHIDTIVPDRDFCSKAERRGEQDE